MKKPDAGRRRASNAIAGLKALYGKPETTQLEPERKGWQSLNLPRNWRARLPDPTAYYREHAADLSEPDASGWASANCPLHQDEDNSLRVNLQGERGGWRCPECGHGDMVGFHLRLTGLPFVASIRDLLGVGA